MEFIQFALDQIITPIFQLAVACAFLYFLFGVAMFIFKMNDSEEARENGKRHLLWGTIGLFIVFSVGGIIKFMAMYFGSSLIKF